MLRQSFVPLLTALHAAEQASEGPPRNAACFGLSTVGSELPQGSGGSRGGEETLILQSLCHARTQAAKEALLSCHTDTARKAVLEEVALVPEQGEFSTVSSLLWFPWGNRVLPCPQPWGSASVAPALCSAGGASSSLELKGGCTSSSKLVYNPLKSLGRLERDLESQLT